MSTLPVRYVGLKPTEVDHLFGTGIAWVGAGDVQQVPADVWPKMAKHPDVWELVIEDEAKPAAGLADSIPKFTEPKTAAAPAKPDNWAELEADALREWAEASGIRVPGNVKKADKIREVIDAALEAKA